MQLHFKKPLPETPMSLLRKAGYAPFTDPKTHEESFVRRLTGEFYPRFHAYVKENEETVTFDVHLDQKKPSYGSGHMHSGEYDGPTLDAEATRIRRAFRS